MANEVPEYRKGIKPTKNNPLIDLKGKRFGRLLVLYQGDRIGGKIGWICQCDCGNKKLIAGGNLTKGLSRSCGCLRKEMMREKATTHNLSGSKLYYIHNNMKRRCYEPTNDHYKWYGAENKGVCEEWLGKDGFKNFADWALTNGYEDGLEIDRKNNSKGYSPDNCRWVTPKQNCRNKRNNHRITINGETKALAEWCEIYNAPYGRTSIRINKGWDALEALTTPSLRKRGKRKDGKE